MEITNDIRIKALKWFTDLGPVERTKLLMKHYNKVIEFTADEVVIIWRRTTGGEWKDMLDK